MKQSEQHDQPGPAHEEIGEEARPLRLDRKALRLDPPVVRFAEERSVDDVPAR